jgi:hypothetical protein
MKANTIVLLLIASSVSAAAVARLQWDRVDAIGKPASVNVSALRRVPSRAPIDSLASAADAIVTNDPFRLSNSPPSVRFDPESDGAPAAGLVSQPRPNLILRAIVGGPPWQAVIDGLPGQPPGTLARAGSKFDRLVVRTVTRDSVIVQGADTAWTLAFRGR